MRRIAPGGPRLTQVAESLERQHGLRPLMIPRHERAAALAKEAFKTGKTIRQLCLEQKILPENAINEALDPWRMTEPH